MVKKVLPVLLLLMLLSFPLFGVTPESWVNTSLSYDWAYESALELTSGKTDTLGYDVSWFGFPAESDIGMETRFGMGFSIDAVPAFTRMNIYVGPVFTETLAYGVTGFVSLGPSYTISGYDAATGSIEQQLGMGLDLGARFKFSGNERFDFGLIAGVFADVALLHIGVTRQTPKTEQQIVVQQIFKQAEKVGTCLILRTKPLFLLLSFLPCIKLDLIQETSCNHCPIGSSNTRPRESM